MLQTPNRFHNSAADAKLRPMNLPARLLLAVFAVSLASLTPVLPSQSFPPPQHKACCADMNTDPGVRCPFNPGGTSSSSAACCTGPAICLLLYFGNANTFAATAE